jgi:hypothetical protein
MKLLKFNQNISIVIIFLLSFVLNDLLGEGYF